MRYSADALNLSFFLKCFLWWATLLVFLFFFFKICFSSLSPSLPLSLSHTLSLSISLSSSTWHAFVAKYVSTQRLHHRLYQNRSFFFFLLNRPCFSRLRKYWRLFSEPTYWPNVDRSFVRAFFPDMFFFSFFFVDVLLYFFLRAKIAIILFLSVFFFLFQYSAVLWNKSTGLLHPQKGEKFCWYSDVFSHSLSLSLSPFTFNFLIDVRTVCLCLCEWFLVLMLLSYLIFLFLQAKKRNTIWHAVCLAC